MVKLGKFSLSRIILNSNILYLISYNTVFYCCIYLRRLLIDRSRKNGVLQETYNNIIWNGRAKDFVACFRVRLDHPCRSRKRFPFVYTIHYTGAEGTGREDCIANKYACAVTMVAVHGAAVAALGFGNIFENRWKR